MRKNRQSAVKQVCQLFGGGGTGEKLNRVVHKQTDFYICSRRDNVVNVIQVSFKNGKIVEFE